MLGQVLLKYLNERKLLSNLIKLELFLLGLDLYSLNLYLYIKNLFVFINFRKCLGLTKVSQYNQSETRVSTSSTKCSIEEFRHQHQFDNSHRLPSCALNHSHISSTPPPGGGQHHDCHTHSCPTRHWGAHTPHNHIGVRPGLSLEDEESSDADMQSFPVDYLPDRAALACMNRALVQRQLSAGRVIGPSHAHCANCGSGQALPSHHSHRLVKK